MGKINSDNLWTNAQAGYVAYSNAMNSKKAAQQSESVEALVRYLENRPIQAEAGDTFTSTVSGAVPGLAIFEAPRGLSWLRKAKNVRVNDAAQIVRAAEAGENAVTCAAKLKQYATPVTDSLRNIATGSGKITHRIGNYFDAVSEFQQNSNNLTKAMTDFYKAEKAAKTGKVVEEAAQVAEGAAKTGKVASALGKVKSVAAKPFKMLAEKVPALGKFGAKAGKLFKGSGAAGFAVIGGGIELATEVVPTFKELGAKAGVKQIGKSAVKVAGDVVGWTVGAKAGAAAGAAIGSIFPGVGTAIGAAVGTFIGGFIGSWGAGKIAKAVTGPTEREKAQAEQDKAQTEAIQSNAKDVEALKQLALDKVQASAKENGYIDEESQRALDEIEKLSQNNPFRRSTPIYA